MYSRVSHNIVEEHFAHPSMAHSMPAPHHPSMAPRHPHNPSAMMGTVDGSLTFDSPLPYYVLTEPTMLFRMDSRTLWSKYAWGLLNYGIALNAGLSDAADVQARMTGYANDLGDFITPYYGLSAGKEFAQRLADIAAIGIQIVQAVKAAQPVDALQASWQDPINSLAMFLNTLNPNNWPMSLLNDMLTNLVTFWADEIQARARGDSASVAAAINHISRLVITGITNSSPTHKASSLADVFSRGVIAQFPALFAG